MPDDPTPAALEEARKIYDECTKLCWYSLDHQRHLTEAIARALDAAELRGRIAGLREAERWACIGCFGIFSIRADELEEANAQ